MLFLNFLQYFQQKEHMFHRLIFYVVYLAFSHLPQYFELPLVHMKSWNHAFFSIFEGYLNMAEVNL